MKTLFKMLAMATVVSGLALGVQVAAFAGNGHGHSHGNHGGNVYGGNVYGGYGGYRSSVYRVQVNYGNIRSGYYGPTWHNTSHYDYHPAQIQRHGNHHHVVPGHYHLHQTGHYHP